MASTKADVEKEMEAFRAHQGEMQKLVTARQSMIAQVNENGMVKQEMDLLEEGAVIFKLVGPILVKQPLDEAKANVEKRLDFIKAELEKVQESMNEKEKESVAHKEKIMAMQREMQAGAAEAAQAAGQAAQAAQAIAAQ
jgi:prefoldin beta subunit